MTGSASGAGVPVSELDRVAGSARGGVTITAPAGSGQPELPLRRYVNPDGSASALVPAGNDWTIDGSNGLIEGSSPSKGSFVFGLFLSIVLPQNAPANAPPSTLISPYLNAANALLTILPRLVPITDLRVERVLRDGVLPTYTSSGMVLIHFKTGGKPWVGVVTLGTDSPEKYGNFSWGFYYSGISVPESSDGSVGQALLRAWHSWDPGAAIAARTRASLALVNETNQMWQEVSQFSAETQDRQARDVGCLLLGYYAIEDNSRAYNLPSAPCGYAYTPANG